MRILVAGGTGIIGKEVVALLAQEHEVIAAGHSRGDYTVDIECKGSIQALFDKAGTVDAIVSITGKGEIGSFAAMSDSGYQMVLENKLMGQINLVRIGLSYLSQGGCITLTSGQASNNPAPGTAAIAMGCSALNTFVASAAVELQNNQRINVVSPSFVKETMEMMGMDSSSGIAAKEVATYFLAAINGESNGEVFNAVGGEYAAA